MDETNFNTYVMNSPAGVQATIRVPKEEKYAKLLFNPTTLRILADEIDAFHKTFWNEPEADVDWTEGRTTEECDAIIRRWNEHASYLLILTPEALQKEVTA